MAQGVILSKRDTALLALLEMTLLTAAQIRKASVTLGDEPFRDERRVRERMQAMGDAGFVKSWPAAIAGGGLMHYYRLTISGFRTLYPDKDEGPARTLVSEIASSRFQHALATAEIIVHVLVAAHAARVRVAKYHGDGKLTLVAGEYRQQPDCHFQFETGGKTFNVLFEVDNATEPLDSVREQSIRTKLLGYEAYQEWVLTSWKELGRQGPPPRFRVVFLTKSATRVKHMLWLANQLTRNKDRRLVVAATQDEFLQETRAVTTPLLLDHQGCWQSLVNLHPDASFLREPVRLVPPVAHVPFV